jgi:ParB/RepB/Spo0J family partition protein
MRVNTAQIRVLDGQNRDNSDKSIIQSVEKEGVLVPLLVYCDPDNAGSYILAAGHRRLASAIHFNLKDVPVEVISEQQAETARALENLDRKGLHPLDEATEIRTLQSQGYENGVISAMLGMPLAKVIRRAKLENLIGEIRESFREGKTNAAVAEEYSVMDPKDQKKVWKSMKGSSSSESVRRAYMNMGGISLGDCTEAFLKTEPICQGCPSNLACDNTLFDGIKGSCTDGKCYCAKMRALMAKEGVDSLFCPDHKKDEPIVNILRKDGVQVISDGSYWRYMYKQSESYTVKKMDAWGDIRWGQAAEEKTEDPDKAARKKELTKQFRKDIKELYANLEKMVFEHADAYMLKNHKDERFPDSDEKVILAKQVIADNHRAIQFFVTGRYDSKAEDAMKGADNRRILAVALFFVGTGHMDYQMVRPEKITEYVVSTVQMPKSMDIEDIYQLKTSKAKKRVMELKKEMEKLLKEYKELEG